MILNAFFTFQHLSLFLFPCRFLSLSLFGYEDIRRKNNRLRYLLLFLKRASQSTLWRKDILRRMRNVLEMMYSFSPSKKRRGRYGSKASGKRELFVIAITRSSVPCEIRTRGKRAKQKYHLQSYSIYFLWYGALCNYHMIFFN